MSRLLALLLSALCLALPALAETPRRASHCFALAQSAPGLHYLHKAGWNSAQPAHSVRIRYIAHASFLLRTEGGLNIVTDYTGFIGNVPMIPDLVTMNHAHETHWTAAPDPAIPHVLRGWGPFGEGIAHHLDLGEVLVRNVSTDIRSPYGGTETRGNSIFVFETAGLCIGHLGHLHHVPTSAQFAALGRLDVVMAPVDGGATLSLGEMTQVLRRLRASVILPMHWFSGYSLDAFLSGIANDFAVQYTGKSQIDLSLRDLPQRPTVMVLNPQWLRSDAP